MVTNIIKKLEEDGKSLYEKMTDEELKKYVSQIEVWMSTTKQDIAIMERTIERRKKYLADKSTQRQQVINEIERRKRNG